MVIVVIILEAVSDVSTMHWYVTVAILDVEADAIIHQLVNDVMAMGMYASVVIKHAEEFVTRTPLVKHVLMIL